MSGMSYEEQKSEICDQADAFAKAYGRRPVLFRPPGGDYDYTTQLAAAACGMKAVVNWIAKANGGSMQYQIGNKLRPGDIVLMHFRPEFKQDMQAFIDAMDASGLHTELLENWLPKDDATAAPLSTTGLNSSLSQNP
jgi:peptidoglycan/xylan/chitin deacetylase (PgdA/CDA1 family)